MKIIKLYGERNTGTNYLSKLIDQNFKVEQLRGVVPRKKLLLLTETTKDWYFSLSKIENLGWKHAAVPLKLLKSYPHLDQTHFITISKNPYSFLLSLYKRPYHYNGPKPASFSEFIRKEWQAVGRDNYPAKVFENPIALWNYKNKSYLQLKQALPDKTYNMTYEALLEDYGKELKKIQTTFELEISNADFENYSQSTKDKNVSHKDYQRYYLNEEWRKDLSPEDIRFINSFLDEDLLDFFNYPKITPALA